MYFISVINNFWSRGKQHKSVLRSRLYNLCNIGGETGYTLFNENLKGLIKWSSIVMFYKCSKFFTMKVFNDCIPCKAVSEEYEIRYNNVSQIL